MTGKVPGAVGVTFAKGASTTLRNSPPSRRQRPSGKDETEALKRRIAQLLVECKGNPFVCQLMGPGLHPEWPTADEFGSTFQDTTQSPASA
jgi:hypothetical protein